MGHYSSFILRFWVEPEQGWRWGLIEHVATRERLRFSSPSEMLEFIQAHSDVNELSLPFALESDDTPMSREPDGERAADRQVGGQENHRDGKKKGQAGTSKSRTRASGQ